MELEEKNLGECPHLILVASPLRTLVEVALGILGVSQSNGQRRAGG